MNHLSTALIVLGAICFGIAVVCIVLKATKQRVSYSSDTWELVDSYVSANYTVSRLVNDYDTRRGILTKRFEEMRLYLASLDKFDQEKIRATFIEGSKDIERLTRILDGLPRIQSCFEYAVQCYNGDEDYTTNIVEFLESFIVIVDDNYIVRE